jgi:hypothetical protein
MNQDERTVIDGIFERMRAAANQPRDPEAEKYIAQHIQAQPYAPYAMAQSVYVQEQALINQQQQIEQLQAQVQHLETQAARAQQAPPQQGGGFLSGIFGSGAAGQPQREPPAYGQRGREAQSASPWGAPAQAPAQPWSQAAPQAGAAPQQRQGMGFLGTAAAAAAGVAGGMMVGNLLSSAFGGGSAHAAPNTAGNFGNLGLDPKQGSSQNQLAQDSNNDSASNNDDYDDADYDDGGDFDNGSDTYEA